MPAQPSSEWVEDSSPEHEVECEIDDLIAEHGSERAAIRALLADADRSTSRGFLRGLFSAGARPVQADDEQ